MSFNITDKDNGIPGNLGQASPNRVFTFPMQTEGVSFDLRHRQMMCGTRVDAIHVRHRRLFIQDQGMNDPVNRFTKKKGLLMVQARRPDRGTMAAGFSEPFSEGFSRVQKVPRLPGPAVSNGGGEIQCQAARIESELTVFRVCVQFYNWLFSFVTIIYGYFKAVKKYCRFLSLGKKIMISDRRHY